MENLPMKAIKTSKIQKDIVLNDGFLTELCRTAITASEDNRQLKLPVRAFNTQSQSSDVSDRCHQMLDSRRKKKKDAIDSRQK